ncbi:hypothetical protein [Agilicoccus flavus]|uniref:hypothetical protein n=1 Tax=Agilicoccus flavus TaxID=2775968 RepID=UPI001CF712AE|nr:hypothetical protein [Agilicoccus flavus]
MPKFTTPYDTLLRVRRIEEDKAKAALAEANLGARRAEQALLDRREHYQRQAASLPHGETDLGGFLAAAARGTAAAKAVDAARADVETADAARGVAVRATLAASQRTQGLERLVERAKQVRVEEMLAADQRTAEESMAGGHARRRGATPPAHPPRDAATDPNQTDPNQTDPNHPMPPASGPTPQAGAV